MVNQYLIDYLGLRNVVVVNKNDIYKGASVVAKNYAPDSPVGTSALGTPVMSDLTLQGKSYIGLDGKPYTTPEINFDTVILTVNQQKNIAKTEIQGRNGTVKEYIGLGDYTIQISAIINFPNGTYRTEEITSLKQALEAPVSLEVTSTYLQMLDIDYLVIDSFDLLQNPGMYSQQIVNIQALSDRSFELILDA